MIDSAKDLNINYSTAKTILRIWRSEKRINKKFKKQRKENKTTYPNRNNRYNNVWKNLNFSLENSISLNYEGISKNSREYGVTNKNFVIEPQNSNKIIECNNSGHSISRSSFEVVSYMKFFFQKSNTEDFFEASEIHQILLKFYVLYSFLLMGVDEITVNMQIISKIQNFVKRLLEDLASGNHPILFENEIIEILMSIY